MYQASTPPEGLDGLIRSALTFAIEAGCHQAVSPLEAALSAVKGDGRRCEVDILSGTVLVDGSPAPLSRGDRALLIALALQRRPCTRDELVEMLYPHLDAGTGATQLKVYVHRVRRRLADRNLIVYQGDSYRLSPLVRVDFWDVEAEISAIMRTKGALRPDRRKLLDEFRERLVRRDVSWCGDREWCSALDRRLQGLLFDVVTRLGESALCDGDVSFAIRLSGEIFSLDPCDERGAELAIKAHMEAGDVSGALRQFRRYERSLREEFGAKASPELGALVGAGPLIAG